MNRKRRRHLLNQPYVKRILALFLCFVLFSSSLPTASAKEPANNRTVNAGVFFFDGYHMQDSDGVYTGYGIELLNLISQYSHLNFEFTGYDKSWAETQAMLLNGEIDVATSARKTRERTDIFAFSLPIALNNTVLSVLSNNTSIVSGEYGTYDGMTVGMLSGSSQNRFLPDFAEENGFTYQAQEYGDSGQLEAALQNGAIDAILTSNLRRSENERLLDTIRVDYFYAITRKDDQDLLDEINYAINQMNLCEGDWANVLYNKYYKTDGSAANGFTQRELDYIEAVRSGEKQITVTAIPSRKPYSYAEDGELKGIQPQFFDSLMQIAELPYKIVVSEDREEYERLKDAGGVDVVIDWQQSASIETQHADGGFLTNTYMNTGTALITRKDFSGPVSSLAVLDGLEGLTLEHGQFNDVLIRPYSSQEDVVQAVLDGETDAAFMRTHAAQFFINNDSTNSLQSRMIDDSEQIAFNMYIPSSSDHELVTILNKCMKQVPDDVLNGLITEYTAVAPENVTFLQYMAAHPGMILLLSALVALAIGVIIFFYLRFRWKNKLLRTTEQSKQELEEQLAIVNALSRDYITVYKLDTREDTIQPLKLEGYTPSKWNWRPGETVPYTETLHRYFEGQIPDENKDDLTQILSLERIGEALSASPEYSETFRIWIKEEIHNFQFKCVAYQAEGQAEPRVLLGFRNIDEIVRKEQKQKAALEDALHMAQAASEAKTSFLSNVSHDIRTPMNAIIGFLTLMQDEADNPEAVREYIGRIDAASQHLLGLINDVLDMSKIESGSTTLSLAEMDLAEVIAEIDTIIQPQAKAKHQTFEISVPHLNFEHLLGDKMRINQILINLLSNSVKYTPENGTIEMRVEELPQVVDNYSRIRFTVSDNGIGMSEGYLKVIFDPFTREDTKTTHEIQGTGLGMPITKSLVDLMGGSIKVDSKLGEGSTFVVELELRIQEQAAMKTGVNPVMQKMGTLKEDAHLMADPTKAAERQESDVVKGMRILVVDDIEVNRIILVKILSTLGAECDTASDGQQAVEKFMDAPDRYGLILMDVQMPVMNGYEATRAIRASSDPLAKTVPIIAMTANAFVDDMRDAIDSGMDAHIAKPVQVHKLTATIRQVLDSRAAEEN